MARQIIFTPNAAAPPPVLLRAALAALLLTAGCSNEATPVSPSPSPAPSSGTGAGAWTGSVNDPVAGEGTGRLVLVEQPVGQNGVTLAGTLSGTWAFTFRNGETVAGPAEGRLGPESGFGLILTPNPRLECSARSGSPGLALYQLTNSLVTSSRMTAVLTRMSCGAMTFGTASFVRQSSE